MKKDPRNLALKVLNRIGGGERTLDGVLETVAAAGAFESHRDRALFTTLVYGVLRWRRRLDHLLGHFVDRPLKKIDPRVLNVMRLGLYQMVCLDRVPHSAAVNTAVELVRKMGANWAVAFVNAVLRRASREYPAVPFPPEDPANAAWLALEKSYPDWLIERWLARFGAKDTIRLCDALNQPATLSLRANTLKNGAADLLPRIRALSEGAVLTPFAPEGIRNCQAAATLFGDPLFQQGLCAVQDEAAQLIALLVDPAPGERILDGCAGLGGKSAHMADLMQNTGEIIAVDRNPERLDRLADEMQRLGISIVRPLALALDKAAKTDDFRRPFDRILVDAPCSGLGVIRRNPDIKWSPLKQRLDRYHKIQSELLTQAAALLKPGGILVYAVCSSEPEETETVVSAFLKNHPEFTISPGSGALTGAHFQPLFSASYFCTYPKHVEMDGFFGARLRRLR